MANMWRRAMVYLGLQDEDADDYDDAVSGRHAAVRPPSTDGGPPEPPETVGEPDPRDRLTVRPRANGPDSGVPTRTPALRTVAITPARAHVIEPEEFNDAREVGTRIKQRQPVLLDLRGLDRDLQRRFIDFSSGLAFAAGTRMERTTEQATFLLTPEGAEVPGDEVERLRARGLYNI